MFLDKPMPFTEAMRHLAAKKLMPTGLDSSGLRLLSAATRRQSLFSSQTLIEDYLDGIKNAITSIVNPSQVLREGALQSVTEGFNPATARQYLKDLLTKLDYSPEAEKAGTIQDLSSDARINLVVKTNVEMVQGAGKFIQGNANPDVVDLWPAWELVRYEERQDPRDWEMRWKIAAEVASDPAALACLVNEDRMVALKSSDIWAQLGDGAGGYDDTLGNPFPPFAFNSGMWTDDVSRKDAEELGLLEAGEEAQPAALDLASLFKEAA